MTGQSKEETQQYQDQAYQSPGGAAKSTRPRSTKTGIKVSSNLAVQHE